MHRQTQRERAANVYVPASTQEQARATTSVTSSKFQATRAPRLAAACDILCDCDFQACLLSATRSVPAATYQLREHVQTDQRHAVPGFGRVCSALAMTRAPYCLQDARLLGQVGLVLPCVPTQLR